MKERLIACYPYGKGDDQYLHIIAEELEREKYRTIDLNMCLKDKKLLKEVSIVNLNWYESVNGMNSYVELKMFIVKLLTIMKLKFLRKKIVFTYHNRVPHDATSFFLPKCLIKLLCKVSTKIIVLCDVSKEMLKCYYSEDKLNKKIVVIPPANYKGCYEEKKINYREQWNLKKSDCVMTFVGAIKPYKNIELIIKAAKEYSDIHFVIAGKPINSNYDCSIRDKLENLSNIIYIPRAIENNEIPALIKESDYIITPYDIKSSLNSGIAILSFTYGRTMIIPTIGTILQMKEEMKNVITYNYRNEEDHYKELCKSIEKAYQLFRNDPEKKKRMEVAVENYIKKNNSRKMVHDMYLKTYNDMFKISN